MKTEQLSLHPCAGTICPVCLTFVKIPHGALHHLVMHKHPMQDKDGNTVIMLWATITISHNTQHSCDKEISWSEVGPVSFKDVDYMCASEPSYCKEARRWWKSPVTPTPG